ncbi:MAG: hypothetical protein V3V99_12790 [candidate division Zixibacteria bacterium]
MRAFQIGNVLGVDSFDVKVKVTARETISPSLEREEVSLLRIDSLRLVLPETQDVLVPELKPWNFGGVHLKSSIFENRLCDRIETKLLYIPDRHDTLDLYFDLVLLDRATQDEKSREKIHEKIVKKNSDAKIR